MLYAGEIRQSKERLDRGKTLDLICCWIVFSAIVQNFILSIADNIVPIDASTVIAVQGMITACAVVVLLWRGAPVSVGMVAAVTIIVGCFILCVSEHDGPNYHFLYDIALIPVFTLLGSTVVTAPAWFVVALIGVTAAVAPVEAVLPDVYQSIVNPLRYYVNTRTWVSAGNDIDSDIGLYIGANRAGGSVFSILGIDHRIGSIFLEPLSLGLFSNVCSLYLCLRQDIRYRPALLGVTIVLPLLADSRTGVVVGVLIVATSRFLRGVPALLCLAVPPLLTLVLWFTRQVFPSETELVYRLGLTFDTVGRSDLSQLFFGGLDQSFANDSGMLYMLGHVGPIGLCAILYLYVASSLTAPADPRVGLYVMLYVSVAAFFGGALFSIKTASLLGFLIGASRGAAAAPEPAPRDAPGDDDA